MYNKNYMMNTNIKIYVLGEELKINNSQQQWICDTLTREFIDYVYNNKCGITIVNDPIDADIIWMIASWRYKVIKPEILKSKYVVSTIHHVDMTKFEENKKMYRDLDAITDKYHTISDIGCKSIMEFTTKEIITCPFWINEKIFFQIENKSELRKKYGIDKNAYVIGSFQRDSEGNDTSKPKLSKGPDIFINILKDISKEKEILVVLTGFRRDFVISELKKNNIKFMYFEMVHIQELNELYNCLDLYLNSSRCDGAPRSIIECGLTVTPIISTDVGIASLILNKKSIYDMNNYLSYRKAVHNVKTAYNNAKKYTIKRYIMTFIGNLFLS